MNGSFFNRMLIGLVLIGMGILFLLNQTGMFEFDLGDLIGTYWPVILIVIGVKGLIAAKGIKGSSIGSLVMVVIGLIFLGRNTDLIDISFSDIMKYIWPILLIWFGVSMIFKTKGEGPSKKKETPPQYHNEYNYEYKPEHPDTFNSSKGTSDDPNTANFTAQQAENDKKYRPMRMGSEVYTKSGFIGDLHLGPDFWELTPMNISHFIGDTVLDLTKAQIQPGETKIVISAFIGDAKVFIPNDVDLEIEVEGSTFLGDYKVLNQTESGFMKGFKYQSPQYKEANKKIRFVINMFIGDITIQKVG